MMKTRSATFYFKICKQSSLKRNERIKYVGQQNEDSREDIDALKSENSFLRKEMQGMKYIIINVDRE